MAAPLVIDERIDPEGEVHRLLLAERDGGLFLVEERAGGVTIEAPLPRGAVRAIARRYGRTMDASVTLTFDGGVVVRADDLRVGIARYRSPVDVEPNDYVLVEEEPAARLVVPARLFAAALRALAR